MDSFASIFQRACERKGGEAELQGLLSEPVGAQALQRMPDDRYLAEMTRCVFRSGFVWKIIENKWQGFEEVFHQFDVTSCALMSEEEQELAATDERIVRNATKIRSVPRNAAFIRAVREDSGSFGSYLAAWPDDDFVGLWDELKRHGDRLGGQTGRFFLRFVGKDTPLMSQDVVDALINQGVVDKAPTGKKALAAVQDAFRAWQQESGRPFCQISRVLSCSVGD